jgi:hypothetical protein
MPGIATGKWPWNSISPNNALTALISETGVAEKVQI